VDLLTDRWDLTGRGRVRDGAGLLELHRPEPIGRVLLVKPLRFMNLSGGPLRAALVKGFCNVNNYARDVWTGAMYIDNGLGVSIMISP